LWLSQEAELTQIKFDKVIASRNNGKLGGRLKGVKPTDQGMQFLAIRPFSAYFIAQVQQTVRGRLLRGSSSAVTLAVTMLKLCRLTRTAAFSVSMPAFRISQHDCADLE
jgi:hypothetical protein